MSRADQPATHPLFRTGAENGGEAGVRRPDSANGAGDAEQASAAQRIARFAAAALHAPMASLAVAAGEGLYVKGCVGFPRERTPRIGSPFLCPLSKHVFTSGTPLAVGDVPNHPIGAGHAGLAALGVRAYLGVPLRGATGATLGMLGIFAHEVREWTDADRDLLADLAAIAVEHGELRAAVRAATAAALGRADDAAQLDARAASDRMDALARFAGAVAHDFNNVLAAVRGYAQIADRTLDGLPQDALPEGVAARLAADVRAIVAATDRAAAVTGPLLAFGGRGAMHRAVLDLNACVAAAQPALRRATGEQVELRLVLDARGALVLADPDRLEAALVALALNARDAMPRGGRLTVETSNVAPGDPAFERAMVAPGRHAGGYVALRVRDVGVGMDDATRRRAVEPLFTTKERAAGAGLGLATVYGFAKQSGGALAIESASGKGATVTIYLPTVVRDDAVRGAGAVPAAVTQPPAAPAADGADSARPERGGGGEDEVTVLVVEDEPGVRQLACTMLARLGHRVVPAASGAEALRLLDALAEDGVAPDVLITDVVMPGMTGPDLAAEVARRHPRVGVLYMSGYNEQVVEQRGELGPGTLFLDKPFTLEQFAARVREVLGAARVVKR